MKLPSNLHNFVRKLSSAEKNGKSFSSLDSSMGDEVFLIMNKLETLSDNTDISGLDFEEYQVGAIGQKKVQSV